MTDPSSPSLAEGAPPTGWKTVAVNEGFDALMSALERAHRKGYMPDAIVEEYEGFDYRAAPPTAENAPAPTEPLIDAQIAAGWHYATPYEEHDSADKHDVFNAFQAGVVWERKRALATPQAQSGRAQAPTEPTIIGTSDSLDITADYREGWNAAINAMRLAQPQGRSQSGAVPPPEPGRGRDDAIAVAVKTCIEFGMYDTNKPPLGHWLMDYWLFGRGIGAELRQVVPPLGSSNPGTWQEQEEGPAALAAVPPALTDERIEALGRKHAIDPEVFDVVGLVRAALAAGSLPASSGMGEKA